MRNLFLSVASAAVLLSGCNSNVATNADAGEPAKAISEALKSSASPEVQTLIDMALAGTQGYDIIESVTTEVGPRLAGSEGEARARVWARALHRSSASILRPAARVAAWTNGKQVVGVLADWQLGGNVQPLAPHASAWWPSPGPAIRNELIAVGGWPNFTFAGT